MLAARKRVLMHECRRRGIVIHHRHVGAEFPLVRAVVVPSLVFGFGAPPFAWMARAILARGSHGLVELGIFSAAYAWGSAVLAVPAQVTRPSMPILTNLLAAGHIRDFHRLFSHWIMRAYGSAFVSGAMVLALVAASSILGSLSAVLRSALVAAGHVWGQALQSLVWGLTLVAVFYVFREHGAAALAGAYVAAFAVSLAIQTVFTITLIGKVPPAHLDEGTAEEEAAMPLFE
jgi:O-antigen/teichoic acid export membrane protein